MAINLTYSNQSSVLSQGLVGLLNSSVLNDVVLACSEGQCLPAHRLILSTFSLYFKEVLARCKEPMPTILLPDVRVTVMEVLLEFMYTGNVRVKKEQVGDLVKANKCLNITGLDLLLSKHVGNNLPPTKKQRIERCTLPPVKTSSLFRPWDIPVMTPTPNLNFPWMNSFYGLPLFSNPGSFPMSPDTNLSNTVPYSLSAGYSSLSETAPLLQTPIVPFPMLVGSSIFSATTPLLPSTGLSLPFSNVTSINSATESLETKKNNKKPRAMKKSNDNTECKVANSKYLVPGKQRCDICKKDFFNLLGHKNAAHGLLKKPIECCGVKFTTRQDIKWHRKSHSK